MRNQELEGVSNCKVPNENNVWNESESIEEILIQCLENGYFYPTSTPANTPTSSFPTKFPSTHPTDSPSLFPFYSPTFKPTNLPSIAPTTCKKIIVFFLSFQWLTWYMFCENMLLWVWCFY